MSKQATPKVNLQKAEAVAQFVGLTARRIYQLTDAGILPVIDTADGRDCRKIPLRSKSTLLRSL